MYYEYSSISSGRIKKHFKEGVVGNSFSQTLQKLLIWIPFFFVKLDVKLTENANSSVTNMSVTAKFKNPCNFS